ncbi:hypothetical protein EJ02DRAFT_429192 [Clathrospora elynae]|uniref:Uncharacterized protein n=1 Tax=Clathrospora elynae TaxID=706981 RepID=A0A6A5S554_9PLEO|nr:hypothetical protein EJ02DRAFT_429192 [Clathrospora elynae]
MYHTSSLPALVVPSRGKYNAQATSVAAGHLPKALPGHCISAEGPIIASIEPNQGTVVGYKRSKGIEVS